LEKQGAHIPPYFLTEKLEFPPVHAANSDGLLAVGGDLSPERLLLAYRNGIFPWFNEDSLILWWSPDPRMILFPGKVKISKSMRKVFKSNAFRLTRNTCFEEIIEACAQTKRGNQEGTWITDTMKEAYILLHQKGFAVSYEVWKADTLVGGLYGIDLGDVFCGESMFSSVSNASKYAFIQLAKDLEAKNYRFMDCQVYTKHLASLGAEEIEREKFIALLQ